MSERYYEIEKLLGNRYVRHILFWMAYILSMTYIHGLGVNQGRYFPWMMNYLIELPVILGLSYSIVYWVVPKFILPQQYIRAFIQIFMLLMIFSAVNLVLDNFVILPLFFNSRANELEITSIFRNAFGLVFPVVIFLSLSLIRLNRGNTSQLSMGKQLALKSELDDIRSRMHPLFLRDALDNIYRMSNENRDILPEMILKISEILHYFLFDCDSEKVPLRKEEQAIRIFMGFEKQSYGVNFNYDIHIQGDLENNSISPYILFPLVRSVCRFNSDYDQNPGKIFLRIETHENILNFSVSQQINPNGIHAGYDYDWNEEINMSRKRLDLIYPWKYKLDVVETERKLMVNLSIDLKNN